MEIGDILTYAYHYNSRHPHFVRVVRKSAKSVWVEELAKKWFENDGYGQNGTVVPDLSKTPTQVNKSFRVNMYNGNEYIKVDGCYAFIWDGKPEDQYTD